MNKCERQLYETEETGRNVACRKGGERLENGCDVKMDVAFWMLALTRWVDDLTRSGLRLSLGHAEFAVPLKQRSGTVRWIPI